MKIIYVRHGHPDYKTDTLTALGKLQAAAAAERLKAYGISEIYSSPRGRAVETAQHAADALGLSVQVIDHFSELGWGDLNAAPDAKKVTPWSHVHKAVAEGRFVSDPDWREKEPWCHDKVVERIKMAIDGLEAFLEQLGYRREGDLYRVIGENTDKTIAIFGHGGHSTAVFAHLMGIPFPHACQLFDLDFTNISVLRFDDAPAAFTHPRFEMFGNADHIRGIEAEKGFMM